MRLLFAAVLLIQAAPAQSEAEKVEAALKKFGDRTYELREDGKKTGTATLRTRVEKDKAGKPIAVFEDEVKMEDGSYSIKTKEIASLDRLRVLSAEGLSREGGVEDAWTLKIDGGKAKIASKRPETTLDISDSTVGKQGLMRIVCIAEQRVGASYKLDVLSLHVEDFEFQPGHAFTCVAKEQMEVDGKKVDAFKWEHKGEWKASMVDVRVWVSPDGYLLKTLERDGGEAVLVTAK